MTPPPSTADITVALEAMRADAGRWRRSADGLRGAATAAGTLALPGSTFSFAGGDVAAGYSALQAKMVAVLEAGVANFEDIATALETSAAAYEAEEQAGVHRMTGIY